MTATAHDTLPHTGLLVTPVPEDSACEALSSDSFVVQALRPEPADEQDAQPLFPYPEGFFAQGGQLHTETTWHDTGYDPKPLSPQPWRDDWMTTIVLLCLIAIFLMLRRSGKQLCLQASLFFLPLHGRETNTDTPSLIDTPFTLFAVLLLSLVEAFVTLWYVVFERQVFLGRLSPYLMLGLLTLCFMAVTFVKFTLYRFIDWVFFDKQKNLTWWGHYKMLFVVEALALFAVITFGTYLGISPKTLFHTSVYIVVFVKLLLLVKGYQIFFAKFHGIFHEIVYLCTLEAAPLLLAIKVLTQFARNLNVIF